jgi:hypothetical protein
MAAIMGEVNFMHSENTANGTVDQASRAGAGLSGKHPLRGAV